VSYALVIGSGPRAFEDAWRCVVDLGNPADHVLVNLAGAYWTGRVDHWCSVHGSKIPRWRALRGANGLYIEAACRYWRALGSVPPRSLEAVEVPYPGGSSGRLAVEVALHRLGHRRVVLAGVPLDPVPHSRDLGPAWRGRAWTEAEMHRRACERDEVLLRDFVRSTSGWTRSTFGAPTREWLYGV
jgi:hypothetical protein